MSKFQVCEDCGSDRNVEEIQWDGKPAPLCFACRSANGLNRKMDEEHKAIRAAIAEAIINSEAFMWLMVGSNHTEAQLQAIRPAYDRYRALGGGFNPKETTDAEAQVN